MAKKKQTVLCGVLAVFALAAVIAVIATVSGSLPKEVRNLMPGGKIFAAVLTVLGILAAAAWAFVAVFYGKGKISDIVLTAGLCMLAVGILLYFAISAVPKGVRLENGIKNTRAVLGVLVGLVGVAAALLTALDLLVKKSLRKVARILWVVFTAGVCAVSMYAFGTGHSQGMKIFDTTIPLVFAAAFAAAAALVRFSDVLIKNGSEQTASAIVTPAVVQAEQNAVSPPPVDTEKRNFINALSVILLCMIAAVGGALTLSITASNFLRLQSSIPTAVKWICGVLTFVLVALPCIFLMFSASSASAALQNGSPFYFVGVLPVAGIAASGAALLSCVVFHILHIAEFQPITILYFVLTLAVHIAAMILAKKHVTALNGVAPAKVYGQPTLTNADGSVVLGAAASFKKGESKFDGGLLGLIGVGLLTGLACLVTCSIALPWMICYREKWYARHTVIDGRRLDFRGSGVGLIGNYLLWMLLTLVTCGIFGLWLPIKIKRWTAKNTVFADSGNVPAESKFDGGVLGLIGINLGTFFGTLFSLGIAIPWLVCRKERWTASHTAIEGVRLGFTGGGGGLFGQYIKWFLLTLITCGIYGFWLNIKMKKWTVSKTEFILADQAPSVQM